MLKKLVKGLVVGAAVFGMAASASAGTYNINIYGASAQHKFWLNLAPDFLTDANGGQCASADQSSTDKKHGITRGNNCLGDGSTIYIRYSSRASYDGVNAVNETIADPTNGGFRDMVDESTCAWGGPKDNSCSNKSVQVNIGASDVAWDAAWGNTSGWEDGNLSYTGQAHDYVAPGGSVTFPTSDPGNKFEPIIVPFAFYANNTVAKFRCLRPEITEAGAYTYADYYATFDGENGGLHKAYPTDMWECDPTLSDATGANPQCVGYFKCVDAVCEGGVNSGQACETANDCPDVLETATRCEAMPFNNINYSMAGLIFSRAFTNWEDFGPYFAPGKINLCMRHAGSGTHATMRDLLQPYETVTDSVANYPEVGFVYHYTSSSDLTRCIADFPGAIGYADADKLLDFKGITDGVCDGPSSFDDAGFDGYWTTHLADASGVAGAHVMQYNGVEPTRQKITRGEYEFWAAQNAYYNDGLFTGVMADLLDALGTFSSDPANLTSATLGNAANFWGAQSEMNVKKTPKTFTRGTILRK